MKDGLEEADGLGLGEPGEEDAGCDYGVVDCDEVAESWGY